MRQALIMFVVGGFIAAASWVPLLIVSARHPTAMLVGLGLFTIAVSFAGGVIALAGLVRFMLPASRAIRNSIAKRDAKFC